MQANTSDKHCNDSDGAGALATVPEHILFQEIDSEIIILDLQNGAYYGLNELGSRVWALIQTKQDFDDVLQGLLKEYNVDESVLRNDISIYLQKLCEANLITTSYANF